MKRRKAELMENADAPDEASWSWTPRALMRAAMRRQPTPRIPCMPQICHDTPVRLYAGEEGGDWIDGLARCIEDRVGLMGGLNTLTLANGTPEEVRGEAIRKCREGGPHGYVLAAGDMVPPQTSLANLRAMVDVAKESLWRTTDEVERRGRNTK